MGKNLRADEAQAAGVGKGATHQGHSHKEPHVTTDGDCEREGNRLNEEDAKSFGPSAAVDKNKLG